MANLDLPVIEGVSERQISYAEKLRDKYITNHFERVTHINDVLLQNKHIKMSEAEEIVFECYNANTIISFFLDITWKFTKEFSQHLKTLNNKKGLYFFYNECGKCVYIGKSSNLKSRIITSLQERKGFSTIKYISTFVCQSMADVNVLEIILISENKPPLNRDCKCRDKLTMFESELNINTFPKIKIFESEE